MIKLIIFYPFSFQLNIYFPREISKAYKDMDLCILLPYGLGQLSLLW